jgi:peptide/nickel transport system permease protein
MTDTAAERPTPTPHYVNPAPWDPYVSEQLTAEQEKYYMAGQWKLMWWRFRRHRPAVVSAAFLALIYFSCLISEWIAPYDLHTRHSKYIFAPPQGVHLSTTASSSGPSSTA